MNSKARKVNNKGIFATLLLSAVITSLMTTAMSTVLPSIMDTFSLSANTAQMVTSIYSLVSGIVIIATAVLIKHFKTRPLFFASLLIFTLGILLCAFSPNFAVLLLGRIFQGMGFGVLISLTQVVILTIIPVGKRGFAMGLYGLAVSFAPVVSPIVAGIIIDHTTWKLIFWLVLILCIINLIMGYFFMCDVMPNEPQHFDTVSMIYAAIGFSGLVLAAGNIGIYPFFSLQVGLLLLLGLISLVLFVFRQNRIEYPLLNLKAFKNKDFTIAVIVSMLLFAITNAGTTVLPILIQTVLGYSATTFGIVIAPCAVFLAGLAPFTGKLYDKIGLKIPAVIGSLLIVISQGLIIFTNESTPLIVYLILVAFLGIGLSGIQMNTVTYGMKGFDDILKSDANAILVCLRTISGALGTAAFVAILSIGATDNNYTLVNVHNSYIGITIASIAVLLISLFLINDGRKAVPH